MSYVPPASNIIAITSGDMSVASGTLKIELNLADKDLDFASDYQMEALTFGKVELDFNYFEGIGDINDFKINVPVVSVSFLDTMRNVNDLSDTASFIDMIGRLQTFDLIVAKITYTFGGASRYDYYFSTRQDADFKFADRLVQMEFKHPLRYNALPYGATWATSLFDNKTVQITSNVNNQIVFPKTFIKEYLSALSNAPTVFYESNIFNTEYDDTPFASGSNHIGFLDAYDRSGDHEFNDFGIATTTFKKLALSDVAVVGNALGYAYYMPRYIDTITNYRVYLDADDFIQFDIDRSFKNVRYFQLGVSYGQNTSSISTGQETINQYGLNDINVNYTQAITEYGAIYYLGSGNDYFDERSSAVSIPSSSAKDDVVAAFKQIFRVPQNIGTTDSGSYISGKIIGVDTLKPYQHFQLDSSINPIVSNRKFKPSMLKYDLINDIIEFEAYEF